MSIKLDKQTAWIIFFMILILQLVITTKLIFFPYPELFIYPYLTNNGLTPYKDILDQHFPGLMFLPVNLNNLGMINEYGARVWQLVLIITTQILLFLISHKITKSYKLALLSSFFFLIWQPFLEGWVLWINNFLPLFYLPAFYYTYKFICQDKKNYNLVFFVGIILGLATVFKQVAIPLTTLVFLLIFFHARSLRMIIYFLSGFLPIVSLMLGYIFSLGAFTDFWYWTIQFNLTTYAKDGGKTPTLSQLIRVLVIYSPVALLPLIKIKAAAQSALKSEEAKLLIALVIFLIGALSGAVHRFDFVHFQPSLPFIIMLTVILINKFGPRKWFSFFAGSYVIIAIIWLSHFYRGHWRNYVYYFDDDTKKTAEVVRSITIPGEEIFVFGTSPIIYQMTDTLPAGKVFVFQFPWFLKISGERVLNGLQSSDPRVIVADFSTETQGNKISEFAPEIYKYIIENYHEDYQIGSNKIFTKQKSYALKD